jgi:hypothetical protein
VNRTAPAELVGYFVVRGAGASCPPGRYALDAAGRWSGPDAGTLAILEAHFRLDRHPDAVRAAALQFGGVPRFPTEAAPTSAA